MKRVSTVLMLLLMSGFALLCQTDRTICATIDEDASSAAIAESAHDSCVAVSDTHLVAMDLAYVQVGTMR